MGSSPSAPDDEIDLAALWGTLVGAKWIIAACVAGATVLALLVAFIMTPVYRSSVLLRPTSDEGGGMSSVLQQMGGVAELVGLSAGNPANLTELAIATLKSRTFLGRFIREQNLMPVLFAKQWDSERNAWRSADPKDAPTMWDGVEEFRRRLSVDKKEDSGLVVLAVEWTDREQAAAWASLLVERVNQYLRKQAIADARTRIEYLKGELDQAKNVELRTVVAHLLEKQVEQMMLANTQVDFAFKVIDPAAVPPEDEYVRPNRLLITALGLMAGVFLGVFIALFRRVALGRVGRPGPGDPAPVPGGN